MTRLYLPLPLATGATVTLPDDAVRHLVQVLRKGAGESLTVFNGEGGEFAATLATASRKGATLSVGAHHPAHPELALSVTIAQCVSKGDRMDYALQKSTELGAAGFVPVLSARGVVKLDGERWEKKVEHWRGVVVGAAEQSGRTAVPTVALPQAFDAFVVAPLAGIKLIAAPGGVLRLRELAASAAPTDPVTVLVGPEGGFAPAELELAERHGWQRLGLGPRILRTETAPVAVLAALMALRGDF